MQFTVLPTELKAAFTAASKAVAGPNAPMPVYENILLTPVSDAVLSVTGSDGDVVIRTEMHIADGTDLHPALINARDLGNVVKYLTGMMPVTFAYQDSTWKISDEHGDFSFYSSVNADEYPMFRTPEAGQSADLDAASFLRAIENANGFVGADDLRPIMTGVCVDFRADSMCVVASDSKKLYREVLPSSSGIIGQVVLPSRVVSFAVKGVLDASAGNVISLHFDQKRVELRQGGNIICSPVIDGRYPRYDAVIPRADMLPRHAEVSLLRLKDALNRASVGMSSATGQLVFSFGDYLRISASDVDFNKESSVVVPLEQKAKTDDYRIGVKYPIIRTACAVFSLPTVSMDMAETADRPIIMREVGSSVDRIVLVVPMQILD